MIWPWQDRHHGFSWLKGPAFALTFVPAIWLIYEFATDKFGPLPLAGLTYWSGVWAMAILLGALAVTPAIKIFRWKRLMLIRRMIGVAGLAYAFLHLVIYFALRFWDFGFITNEMITRFTLIVATVSTLGLTALGATSVDAAVRKMGARGWQRLHNTVYAFSGLALFHYLLSPGIFPEQYLMSGMFFWLMAWRVLDRSGLATDPINLALLAVASAVFTALFEIFWTWVYQDVDPVWTLGMNFTLQFGISPSWKVLGLGLLIALGAIARRGLALQASTR